METGDIRVTLDAREIPARILSLSGRPKHPASGDVLITHAAPPFVLDDARTLHLRDAGRETGLVLNGDQKIACRVGHARVKNSDARQGTGEDPEDWEDTKPIFVNPLLGLTHAEFALLRGVSEYSDDGGQSFRREAGQRFRSMPVTRSEGWRSLGSERKRRGWWISSLVWSVNALDSTR
jgi:hypothetical protein